MFNTSIPLKRRILKKIATLLTISSLSACAQNEAEILVLPSDSVVEQFIDLLIGTEATAEAALDRIEESWQSSYIPMALESLSLSASSQISKRLNDLIAAEAGQDFNDRNKIFEWLWSQPYNPHPDYAEFKSRLYRLIDPAFEIYFSSDRTAHIRLDEVRWGGVRQDGIPPLRKPKMISVDEATYLGDNDVIFGISVNGDHRAYPKRILAWHEMFEDVVGDEAVNGVYCTLCGSMILYKTIHDGTEYRLGTSGFLYRSNKVMYDKKTQSLWNTLQGKPVIGPLADKDIELERLSVVTSTWGEWKRRHPDSTVLSLDTGHQRDYSEGRAYKEYFGTDKLMFNVPKLDRRLPNKTEVLALIFPDQSDETLAITADFLAAHPVYHDSVGPQSFVVLTDASGANRIYETDGVMFNSWDGISTVLDEARGEWNLREDKLTGPNGKELMRLPAHRAFWFAWKAVYEDTRLVGQK